MFDPHDLTDPLYNSVIDHGELYDFVEIAQNNHQQGQLHYDRILGVRARLAAHRRPMTNVKIYGAAAAASAAIRTAWSDSGGTSSRVAPRRAFTRSIWAGAKPPRG